LGTDAKGGGDSNREKGREKENGGGNYNCADPKQLENHGKRTVWVNHKESSERGRALKYQKPTRRTTWWEKSRLQKKLVSKTGTPSGPGGAAGDKKKKTVRQGQGERTGRSGGGEEERKGRPTRRNKNRTGT